MKSPAQETASTPESMALELRVLAGPQRGARTPLARDGDWFITMGSPTDDGAPAVPSPRDVVLHALQPARLQVHFSTGPRGDVLAHLTLLRGAATIGDRAVEPLASTPWLTGALLQIGETALAFGPVGQEDWLQFAPGADADGIAPASGDTLAPAPERLGDRRWPMWLAGTGAVLVFGSAALLSVAQLATPAAASVEGGTARSLEQALRGTPYAGLHVTRSQNGGVELAGQLASTAQRAQLESWLASRGLLAQVNLNVQAAGDLELAVADVFRLNGVKAEVTRREGGGLQVQAAEPDTRKLARAEASARRDVAGLQALQVVNRPPAQPSSRPGLQDDPGKRITAVVTDDDLPYIVTADGSRYFYGALLPSGHRVVSIADKQVIVELDGQSTQLSL